MKRTVADVLRRGFQNAVANWHLLLLRFAENAVLAIVIVGAGFATVLPMVFSIIAHPPSGIESPDDLRDFLISHAGVFFYAFIIVTIVSLIAIAVHSFVIAGVARVLVDGNRRAADAVTRDRFRAFTFDTWLDGGRKDWLAVFWIYNFVYGVVGLIVVIPLCLIAVLEVFSLLGEMKVAAIATGCIGVPLVVFLFIVSAIISSVWVQKSIIVCVDERRGARDAMRTGWSEARADLSRHFGVAFILLVISIGGSGVISTFSFGFSLPMMAHGAGAAAGLVFVPLRILVAAVSAVFTSAVGLWSIASFAALSEKS